MKLKDFITLVYGNIPISINTLAPVRLKDMHEAYVTGVFIRNGGIVASIKPNIIPTDRFSAHADFIEAKCYDVTIPLGNEYEFRENLYDITGITLSGNATILFTLEQKEEE